MDYPAPQGLHFNDYLHVLLRRKKYVLIPLIVVFLTGAIYTFRLPPVYQASTTVQVENEKSMSILTQQPAWVDYGAFSETWLATQARVMKSRPIAEKVVKKIGLQLQMKTDSHTYQVLLGKWFSKAAREKIKIKPIAVSEEIRPGVYTGLFISDKNYVIYARDGQEIGKGEMGKPFTAPQFSFKAEGRAKEGETFTLQILPYMAAAGAVQGSLITSPVRNTNLIAVNARWKDPEIARDIANAVAEEYRELVILKKSRENSEVLTFVEEQLQAMDKEKEKSEELLKQFKGNEKFVTLDSEVKKALDQVAAYEKEIMTLQSYRRQAEILLASLKTSRFAEPEALFSIGAGLNNDYLKDLGKKLNELNSQRAGLILSLKEEHPKIQQADREMETVKKNIAGEIGGLISSLRVKEKTLQDNLKKFEAKVQKLPATEKELFDLERVVKVNHGITSFLLQKRAELAVNKGSILTKVYVIEPAVLPGGFIEPNVSKKILWALLLGSLFGVGLAFFLEYLDTTVKTPEQLQNITNLAYLGTVYHAHSEKNGGNGELRMLEAPYSHVAEAFRTIKTNLLFSRAAEEKKFFLVTSSGPQEGKTFVTANLAAALAQSGKRVLVLETDLRNPSLRRIFGGQRSPGLTNILLNGDGKNAIERVSQKTCVGNLEFVSSGDSSPNPSELLGSEKMDRFLSMVRDKYDFVLFDSPPAFLTSDSLVLAQKADGVIYVARSGWVQREILRETVGRFLQLKIKMLGIILNDMRREGKGYYYYKYSYYYGNNGEKVKKKTKVRRAENREEYLSKAYTLPPGSKKNNHSDTHTS
jgi:tyrosine-protein kinase Etk/Wzc